jgi:Ca-activated chloride channel homolog
VRAAFGRLEARASTALHEGWLRGCQAIASDGSTGVIDGLARCFLLTDGQANAGITDPEKIASDAALVRENAGVGTSTFGIGADYDESLLAPLAVAGGGQFHHLRNAADIADTFVGELGDLLAVATRQVHLEVEPGDGVGAEVVSEYWSGREGGRVRVAVGDLLAGEERQVVLSLRFPPGAAGADRKLRARVAWRTAAAERVGEWVELAFVHADDDACRAETADPEALRWSGLHLAERAKRDALKLNRKGDFDGSRRVLREARSRLDPIARGDAVLGSAASDLDDLDTQLSAAPIDTLTAKELHFQSQRTSRGQRDHRHSPADRTSARPDDLAGRSCRAASTGRARCARRARPSLTRRETCTAGVCSGVRSGMPWVGPPRE